MAVAFKLTASPLFAQGQSVGAYELALFAGPRPPRAAPPIAATETAVVDAHGFVNYGSLKAQAQYVAGALVAGEWRYVAFATGAEGIAGGGEGGEVLAAPFTMDGGDGTLTPADLGLTIDFGDTGKYGRLLLRGDTAAKLAGATTPARKELLLETDTAKLKIGDGTTGYSSLPYFGSVGYTAAQADARYLRREVVGPFTIAGTPFSLGPEGKPKTRLVATSTTTAEWQEPPPSSSGISPAELEKLLQLAEGPMTIAGNTSSASNNRPWVPLATGGSTGRWEDLLAFVELFLQPRLATANVTTSSTLALGTHNYVTTAGVTVTLPSAIVAGSRTPVVRITNASGGEIKVKGPVEQESGASVTIVLNHAESIGLLGWENNEVPAKGFWRYIDGYRSQAVLEEITRAILPGDRTAQAGELIGQSFDLPTGKAALTAGTVYLVKIPITGEVKIKEICLEVVKAGLTLTGGNFAGLIAGKGIFQAGAEVPQGTLLSKTLDEHAALEAEGAALMKLRDEAGAAQTLTLKGVDYISAGNSFGAFVHAVVLLNNGAGTMPELATAAYSGRARDVNMATLTANLRSGHVATGQSALVAYGGNYSTGSYVKTSADPFLWVGLA